MREDLKIVLIPAYNPEPCLKSFVQKLKEKGFWILVVDDGSEKEYKEIFRDIYDAERVLVLAHAENKGKGCALKTGLSYLQNNISGNYTVVTADADGQHSPTDVEIICQEAQGHPGYLILGSRKIQKKTPFKSKFGNRITRMVYLLTTGVSLYDTQTGLRAFVHTLVPEFLTVPGERYEYEMNVLLECSRKRIPMKEVEIETIYVNENAGSHFHPWKDSCRIYKEIFKFSASSFASFLLDYGMYSVLLWMTGGLSGSVSLFASNVTARIVSGCFNYHVNRKLVFQNEADPVESAVKYLVLAAGILVGNTLVLNRLVYLGMNPYTGKLCTEFLFFIVSWFVQRTFIFKRRRRSRC